jgi:hypothetical protein
MQQLWFKEEEVNGYLAEHERGGYTDDEQVMACRLWLATLERLNLDAAAAHGAAITRQSTGDVTFMYLCGVGAHLSEEWDVMMDGDFVLEDIHFIPVRTEGLVDYYEGVDQAINDGSFGTDGNANYESSPACEYATSSYPTTYSLSAKTPASKGSARI